VKIHDPYYTEEEIRKITKCESFGFPEGLQEFDAVLIVADHSLYKFMPNKEILKNLKNCKLILDNTEIWKKIDFPETIEYHIAGNRRWLG